MRPFLLIRHFSWLEKIPFVFSNLYSLAGASVINNSCTDKWTKGNAQTAFENSFLLPMAILVASVVLLWRALFNGQGILNHLLFMLSLKNVDWMNTGASFGVLVISYIWRNLGYDIVLWLAGAVCHSGVLYEAAMDGAGTRNALPVSPCQTFSLLFTIVVLSLLNGFKVYRRGLSGSRRLSTGKNVSSSASVQ